jgi:hypothetical protein
LITTGRRIISHSAGAATAYLILFVGGWLGISLWYAEEFFPHTNLGPSGAHGIVDRVPWYLKHRNQFNLLFVGDSRTYCGIHTGLIDPQLGTRGINLAQFSHWFPTQYSMMRDIVPLIPRGTLVVWSVGHQNFYGSNSVQRVYPIGLANALRLEWWGVKMPGIADNVLYYSPLTFLIADRSEARSYFFNLLANRGGARQALIVPLKPPAPPADPEPIVASELSDPRAKGPYEFAWADGHWGIDRRIDDAYPTFSEDGTRNSVVLYTKRGSYYRIELNPAFFRAKQQEMHVWHMSDEEAARWEPPPPEPAFWKLFDEMLLLCKEHGIHLIVNEFEEAPFSYSNRILKGKWRSMMRSIVARRVEEYGFRYIYVDFNSLSDDDYFDYNHLNSKGIAKFTPMLVEQLRPFVRASD